MVMFWRMQVPALKILAITLAAIFALGALDAALAREKKPRVERPVESGIEWDASGTPIIMRETGRPPRSQTPSIQSPSIMRDEEPSKRQRVERPRTAPRGSGGTIPPPVPSPYVGPPSPVLLQPPPTPYKPPPVNSFGDRVVNCIHSYPLNAGIGNNPTDRQTYIRQCAN